MPRSRLLWKLCAGFAVVIVVTAAAVAYFVASQIARSEHDQLRDTLASTAALTREMASNAIASDSVEALQSSLWERRSLMRERISVIAPDGRVLVDTREDPSRLDDHSGRPEVVAAMRDGVGTATRFSATVRRRLIYYAERIDVDGKPVGVARVAVDEATIERKLADIRAGIALGTAIASLLGLVVAYVLARLFAGRVGRLTEASEQLAAGAFNERVPVDSEDEIGQLSRSFNRMASLIESRVEAITEERNKLIGILRSMVEGVVAIDRDETVVQINTVAMRLLGVTTVDPVGSRIWEATRERTVCELLARVLESGEEQRGEIVTPVGAGDRVVELEASPVRDAESQTVGALVLLHDVTERRKLETIRRDFVANVSHELKTPLTAIRGLLETIRDDEAMPPTTRGRFLEMASRQTDRLSALVTDLLTLSRLESESVSLDRRSMDLRDPVRSSLQNHASSAEAKSIAVHAPLPEQPVPVVADAEAVRQVADNLLGNAIKYTPGGGEVWVTIAVGERHVSLEVRDNGPGIDAGHLPRLFERFYRVDKARSRELGGTGLGLSIVKHIMIAHSGDVRVESTVGVGSRFIARFPRT